jgi:hypothetical protein
LTHYVTPEIYTYLDAFQSRIGRRFSGGPRAGTREEVPAYGLEWAGAGAGTREGAGVAVERRRH